jgi:drug/metabolite transporter (DMT)-like permease
MWAALISAISDASGTVLNKIILSRERVKLSVFLPILFLLLFSINLILVPFLGKIDWQIFLLPNTLFLFFLMVVIAVAHNVLFYQSIQRENIYQHEMIMMMGPFITIVLGATFFPEELQGKGIVFLLSLIASLALIWSKGTKEHLFKDLRSYNAFLAVVLMSTESIIIRDLLYSMTPVALYATRTFVVALFFFLYYRPKYHRVSARHWRLIALSALLGVGLMVARFYAYTNVGIVFTTLVSILAPVIVFFASWEILHEKIRPRMIVASMIILACVTWATVLTFR